MSDNNDGCTNYETKVVLDGVLNNYAEISRQLTEILSSNEDDSHALGKALEEFVWEEMLGHITPAGFAFDLITAAMLEVNWEELGESLLGKIEY